MKKLLALFLAVVLLIPVMLTGCGNDEEIKGAEVQMFLTTLPQRLDPAAVYSDADTVKVMGLLYEGLTTLDEKGKVEKALAKDWEYEIDERDNLMKLEIQLEKSRWSDGIIIDADDFIYAWTRILLPENNNSNAALLYPIHNAQAVKEGRCSVNDLGLYAIEDDILQVVFEPSFIGPDHSKKEVKANIEYFMKRLSSPSLVPLRQDVCDKSTDWCEPNNANYVTNGPFKIKAWNSAEFSLERSIYYRCVSDNEKNAADKIVKPYRLITSYMDGKTANDHIARYAEKQSFYLNLSTVNNSSISDPSIIETNGLLSTACLIIDTTKAPFDDVNVRKALSMSIDRNAIAANVLGATPATGFVPYGVEDASAKEDFREKGGALISVSANMAEAKKLVKNAEIGSNKYISIEYSKERPAAKMLAQTCKKAWEELGFTVNMREEHAVNQKYIDSKANGDLTINQNHENDACVFICDLQCTTPDAYSMLASLSNKYGGAIVDVVANRTDVVYDRVVCGYDSDAYDEICRQFVQADNTKERTDAMHKAEEQLISDMPIIPVYFNTACYISQDLSNMSVDNYGRLNFTELKQKNFKDYLPRDEEGNIDQ